VVDATLAAPGAEVEPTPDVAHDTAVIAPAASKREPTDHRMNRRPALLVLFI
jgi:hypothetical protein